MFLMLADLPPILNLFPKVECPGVMIWSMNKYKAFLMTEKKKKKTGVINGNPSTSEP